MEGKLNENLIAQSLQDAKRNASKDFKKNNLPKWARFRLQLKRSDGSTSVPYPSYDIHKIYGHKGANGEDLYFYDEQLGYSKLVKLLNNKMLDMQWAVGTIFMNATTDTRVFIDGRMSKHYNHAIEMRVRNRNPWTHGAIKFYEKELKEFGVTEKFIDVKHFLQHEKNIITHAEHFEATDNRIGQGRGQQLADYSKLRSLPPNEVNQFNNSK